MHTILMYTYLYQTRTRLTYVYTYRVLTCTHIPYFFLKTTITTIAMPTTAPKTVHRMTLGTTTRMLTAA